MNEFRKRGWANKFRVAFRGIGVGLRGQSSFRAHFAITALVILAGIALRVNFTEWCLLGLCIAAVLTAEMFNSALEHLGRAIDQRPNAHLANALDIASGAVLLAAVGAAIIGAALFLRRLSIMLDWL